MTAALAVEGLFAGYGRTEVLHGIDLHVEEGEVVCLLGANGAGKTTTLLALAGAIGSRGKLEMFGRPSRGPVHERAKRGLAFLPDQRGIVRALTVGQNFRLAGVDADEAYLMSPELKAIEHRRAGDLSGGEQQILALTRAIASRPKLLLADEMSFGLGPIVVTRMFDLMRDAATQGTAVLIVEQFARRALEAASRAYVLQRGTVALEGRASDLLGEIDKIERSYLGSTSDEHA